MRGSDLAVLGGAGGRVRGRAVVQRHVGFDLVRVRARGRLPAGLLGAGVEVVGEVFGVGVADFPLEGQAGVAGGGLWGEWVQKGVDGEAGEEGRGGGGGGGGGGVTHHVEGCWVCGEM